MSAFRLILIVTLLLSSTLCARFSKVSLPKHETQANQNSSKAVLPFMLFKL
jgi:hypothetical protein